MSAFSNVLSRLGPDGTSFVARLSAFWLGELVVLGLQALGLFADLLKFVGGVGGLASGCVELVLRLLQGRVVGELLVRQPQVRAGFGFLDPVLRRRGLGGVLCPPVGVRGRSLILRAGPRAGTRVW